MASKTEARKRSSVVSPWKAVATVRPIWALISLAADATASDTSTIATARAPRCASCRVSSRPMPLAAPVTTATRFAISKGISNRRVKASTALAGHCVRCPHGRHRTVKRLDRCQSCRPRRCLAAARRKAFA